MNFIYSKNYGDNKSDLYARYFDQNNNHTYVFVEKLFPFPKN